jgi:hypothetical protein
MSFRRILGIKDKRKNTLRDTPVARTVLATGGECLIKTWKTKEKTKRTPH